MQFGIFLQKHIAKGRDVSEAVRNVDSLSGLGDRMKQNLREFSDRLECLRDKIEGATRLLHLINLDMKEKDVQHEMEKLAEKIGALNLIERRNKEKMNTKCLKTSTPTKEQTNCACWHNESQFVENRQATVAHDDDEDHSKMADSGLGGCERCEGNEKLIRSCSCQSLDEPTTICSKR